MNYFAQATPAIFISISYFLRLGLDNNDTSFSPSSDALQNGKKCFQFLPPFRKCYFLSIFLKKVPSVNCKIPEES